MKSKIIVIFTVLSVLFIFSNLAYSQEHEHEQGERHESGGLSDEDIAAVGKVLDAFAKSYVDNDIDALMALFAETAVYLEGRGMNDGKKAIRDDHLGSHFASTTYLKYDSKDRVISGNGTVAYVHEIVTRQQQAKNSDTPSEPRIRRVLYVLEKQSNGTWLIALLN